MESVYSPIRSEIFLKKPRKDIKSIIDSKKLRGEPLSKEGFKVILDEVSFKEQINHNQVTLGILIPANQNCDQSLESIKQKTLSEFLNMQMSNVKVRIFKTNYQFI